MMSVTKAFAFATCLLSFFALGHGAKNGLLRKKSFADAVTYNKLSLSENDLQSAFRELLSYHNLMGSEGSMSLSMSMSYSGPVSSSTVRPATAAPTYSQSPAAPNSPEPVLRPSVSMEPTASPVIGGTPTAKVNSVTSNTKSTGDLDGKKQKEQKASLKGLSGGALAGIAVAAVAVVAVAAVVAKTRNAPSPVA